jgi:hypothetical protein
VLILDRNLTVLKSGQVPLLLPTDSGKATGFAIDNSGNVYLAISREEGDFIAVKQFATLGDGIAPNAVVERSMTNLEPRVYPNPLSHATTISFIPKESGYADVSIVNLLGMKVAHLFSGEVTAHEQNLTWQPAGIPNGIYECLIRVSRHTQTVPLILRH